jgi:hypothetical protein
MAMLKLAENVSTQTFVPDSEDQFSPLYSIPDRSDLIMEGAERDD